MLTFTQGDIKPSSIKSWLRKNESKLTVSQLGADSRKTNAVMFTEKDEEDVIEESENEINELETYLAELHDGDHGGEPKEEEVISEQEAAEILATFIDKKKKSFTQTVKAKKYQELSRGYGLRGGGFGKGDSSRRPPFRKKGGNLMIEELKLRTRCGICHRVGHWHRECPNKDKADIGKNSGGHEKEAHYLSRGPEFETSSEAYFCGLLDALPGDGLPGYNLNAMKETNENETQGSSSTERDVTTLEASTGGSAGTKVVPNFESFPKDLHNNAGSTADFERQHHAAYMESVFELFHFENVLSRSCRNPSLSTPHFNEETCATIDTGCQRLAIGLETLYKLMHHLPSPLEIHTIRSTNRFKSVHGVSTTNRIANVPSSLGTKGCILRPAIFEDSHGKNAPFLLSLPLLMHGGSMLCLEPNHGLFLKLGTNDEKIPCHLGPTGALRVPILAFTSEKLRCLTRDLEMLSKEEFEILTIENCRNSFDSKIKPVSDSTSRTNSVPPSTCDHGGQPRKEAKERSLLRLPGSLEVTDSSPSTIDPTPDTRLGEPVETQDEPNGRRITTQHQSLEPRGELGDLGRTTTTYDASKANHQDTFKGYGKPRSLYNIEELYEHTQEEEPDRRSSGHRGFDGQSTSLQVLAGSTDLDGFHGGSKLRESILEVPEAHGTPMQVLPMDYVPTHGGSGSMEVPGGRVRQQAGATRDSTKDDPTQVWPRDHHTSRNQRLPTQGVVQDLQQGLREEEQEPCRTQQCQLSRQLRWRDSPGGEDAAAIQAIHGVAKDATPKVVRQVRNALKKAISFWRSIQQVLSFHETDDSTVTGKLKQLNDEILNDLIQNPKGSKRTQAVAEAMHLEVRSLKTIAEIYNPGCFGRISQKHGLESGKAFDLTLGTDLLDFRNREHVRTYVKTIRLGLVLIAPPCHMYSQLQNILKDFRAQDSVAMKKYLEKKSKAKILLNFAIEIAELCLELGLTFVLEHPWSAQSWSTRMMEKLIQREDVFLSRTDQCMFGLKGENGVLHRKRTGFATNNEEIYKILNKHCQGQHDHEQIIGGNVSRKSQQYPEALLHAVLKAYSKSINSSVSNHSSSQQVLQQDLIFDQWFTDTVSTNGGEVSMGAELHEVLLGEPESPLDGAGEEEPSYEPSIAPDDGALPDGHGEPAGGALYHLIKKELYYQ